VAAVLEAMLRIPVVAARLARLAQMENLPDALAARICVLMALHDFGKANLGFQARWQYGAPTIGHIKEAQMLLGDPERVKTLRQVLGFDAMESWGDWPQGLLAMLAHHGRPLDISQALRDNASIWGAPGDHSPVLSLASLGQAVRRWYPHAFEDGGPPLPQLPEFWHEVAGLAMLADWIGSDGNYFQFANGASRDRISEARSVAIRVLEQIGFSPKIARASLRGVPEFSAISDHLPRPIQVATGVMEGDIVVLESETGSGKTEAALYRFARLFAQGTVDGLYFALPTRVAATALYHRVVAARNRLFPEASRRPGVVLAVPGC
jgi:CRISPR-associated endonuclease/helicase Cas3